MPENKKMGNNSENRNQKSRLSSLIRDLREYLKLSQASFAKPIGLSPTHIARFEKGISIPTPEAIDAICESFSVDRKYFEPEKQEFTVSVEDAVERKDPKEGIAERVKTARIEKGWSQNELAKQAGVNHATINRVEFGAKLTEKQAVKIAEVLEVGIEWLLTGDEEKKRYPVDQKMIQWLWSHTEARCELWNRMKQTDNEEKVE